MNEFTFFADPSVDRVVSFSWQLAQELQVARHRLTALEQLLVRKGVVAAGELDQLRPDADEAARLAESRDQFVARLMRVLTERDDAAMPMRDQFADRLAATAAGAAQLDDSSNPPPGSGATIRKDHA